MKKIISVLSCLIMILSLTSCMSTGSTTASKGSEPEYKNAELETMCKDLATDELIAKEATKLDASFASADEGYRFVSSKYGNVEIYYFSNKDNNYYKDAKEGKITLFGTEYNSVVSKSGNCVLVYSTKVEETGDDKDLSKKFSEYEYTPDSKTVSDTATNTDVATDSEA